MGSSAKNHFLKITSKRSGQLQLKEKGNVKDFSDDLPEKIKNLTSCPPPGFPALWG